MNIRSLTSNLQTFVDQCLCDNLKFDAMAFSETRLENNIVSLFNIPGYNLYVNNRDRKGGGVCVYVSNIYNSCVLSDCGIMESYFECVCVKLSTGKKSNFLASVYRPPRGNISDFLLALDKLLNLIESRKFTNYYFRGDWNLDLLKPNDTGVLDFMNLMYSYGFLPLTTKPTRVTDTGATLIDHIWTTQPGNSIKNCILYTDITDHFPVYSHIHMHINHQKHVYLQKRNYSNGNIKDFINNIKRVNWEQTLNTHDPCNAFEIFLKLFNDVFQLCFPVQEIKVTNKYCKSPYVTNGIKNSIKEKHRLEKLAAKWPLTYKSRYKNFRNKLVTILRNAKNKYYQDELKARQGDAKATWKIINQLMGRSNNTDNTNEITLKNQSAPTATVFNYHFLNISVIPNQNGNIQNISHREYLNNPSDCSVYFYPVTGEEIQHYLKSLKSTAAGYDEIPPEILRLTAQYISVPLTHIINLCFRQGYFPKKMKIAKVKPIFKVGEKEDENIAKYLKKQLQKD